MSRGEQEGRPRRETRRTLAETDEFLVQLAGRVSIAGRHESSWGVSLHCLGASRRVRTDLLYHQAERAEQTRKKNVSLGPLENSRRRELDLRYSQTLESAHVTLPSART